MTCATLRHVVVGVFFLAGTMLLTQGANANAQENPTNAQGPRGTLRIKGISGHDSVYLNGTSQDFLVGRVDQMNGKGIFLSPGQQHVIIVNPNGNRQVYSGYVVVVPNKRATLRVDKSAVTYENWANGEHFEPASGVTSAALAPAPVTAQITANPSQANCEPVKLAWTSNGYNTLLKLDGVAVGHGGSSGEQVVDPKKTTTYQLEAFGPGGVTFTPVTVVVNNAIKTTLSATPTVVRYHKVGDSIVDPGTATLNWTASNAQNVVLEPFGEVAGTSGEKDISFTPGKTDFGPIEETRAYKIIASNDCGGSDTTTALVQVAGSIDPPIVTGVLPPKLPQTGSPLPLIGLLGLGSLASGIVLRRIRRK